MLRFFIFLILFFILIAICIYYKEKMNQKLYIFILSLIIVSFVIAFIYSSIDNSYAVNRKDLIQSFRNGENLICDKVVVSNKDFKFDNGTSVFINPQHKIDIKNCKKEKE
ncbi:hypothetical protein [Campylobacter canadensis]|uniref:DUF2393 domain-containing protein n=1 Tax=Campylobacter canadensis TaxID=449520 RepID=A0ABS7WS54_9BACT|nr:hypothetical protein [Campylobacter canadensis]MBZ7987596.1 hypothetical protein [Campylobacter canadensis]MBZ7994969.1 hypothetical protein [Campylobacter canadensis]MBZ7996881.1 hypothetical protein [Campylobacter canadensis]MBZ7998758.1 hypothetical protein [Campylobacter canadensis]MBZ8000360.1 hypothetical protein [Campylobacter canadensis]